MNGIKLIRLREETPILGDDIADRQFGGVDLFEAKNLSPVIDQLLAFLNFSTFRNPVSIDIERDKYEILSYAQKLIGESLETAFPQIAKEWNYSKNGDLKPSMFRPHSDISVWWKCTKCGNEYYSRISARSYGTSCPLCGIERNRLARGKRVLMIDPSTNEVIRVYETIADAGRDLKINNANITSVCKGTRQMAGGYIWRYEKNLDE